MTAVRISKYFTNDHKVCAASEWTSISDIGAFRKYHLRRRQYLQVERQYMACLREILSQSGIKELLLRGYEQYEHGRLARLWKGMRYGLHFPPLPWTKSQSVSLEEACEFCRDCLRERCWGRLLCGEQTVDFGYDYLMYVCVELPEELVRRIAEKHGLLCEFMDSPYKNVSSQE